MQDSKSLRLPIFAVAEWLLILPSALLLTAAMLRLMQPRQYEPAHTSWIIFDWTTTHISHPGAAVLFLALPGLAALTGCGALARLWRSDQSLRADAALGRGAFRRHWATISLAMATLAGFLILVLVVAHIFTD